MRKWVLVLAAVLVAAGLAIGLAACGDDDDGGSADTAASTAAAADLGLLEAGRLQVASEAEPHPQRDLRRNGRGPDAAMHLAEVEPVGMVVDFREDGVDDLAVQRRLELA